MLINEKHVVLETSIEVWLEAEVHNHRIVVAVDVSIYTVHALEDLADKTGECLWKWDA
jgi:hypothetical protein